MSLYDPKHSVFAEEESIPGMKILYADRSEPGVVTYIHDVVYTVRNGMPLHLQMLYPEVPESLTDWLGRRDSGDKTGDQPRFDDITVGGNTLRMPSVVFVQGSAWGKQNCYGSLPKLIDVARQGFVVVSAEYRPASTAPFPGFVEDIKTSIRFLKANAGLFGIDPARIAVWGCSSGGHTALMVGATGWTREFDDGEYLEQDSSVCACVSYYGVAEFHPFLAGGKFARPHLFDMLLGKEEARKTENVDRLSPAAYIREEQKYPPFLLMHGDEDVIVPFEQSVIMYNRLRECGKRAELVQVRGANHGKAFWTPEVLEMTGRFLKAYV